MNLTDSDKLFFQQAIKQALTAEENGNLPIGAVIVYGGEVVAAGQNAIWYPSFNANRHAEIEALRQVPAHLWEDAANMTLYSTLEPCLMCTGAILLHHIGRVRYGAADHYGGASQVIGHMPAAFEELVSRAEWLGPIYPQGCNPLFARVLTRLEQRRSQGQHSI